MRGTRTLLLQFVLTRRSTYSIFQTPCNQASSEEDPAKGHNYVSKVLSGEHRHILKTKLQSLNRL